MRTTIAIIMLAVAMQARGDTATNHLATLTSSYITTNWTESDNAVEYGTGVIITTSPPFEEKGRTEPIRKWRVGTVVRVTVLTFHWQGKREEIRRETPLYRLRQTGTRRSVWDWTPIASNALPETISSAAWTHPHTRK